MKTILLKLAGPLQSWGTSSRFETRHTDRYPSKSAITGILTASFGYSRDDTSIQKFNLLDFAVRIDQPGELLCDFHVARRIKPDGTLDQAYVTNRYYVQDAVYVVALGSSDEVWIGEIEYAIKHPYYQPFMGRRSNPLNPDFFLGSESKDVITCLEETPWQASEWYKRRHKERVRLPIYSDAHLLKDSPQHMVKDRIISLSQKERLYDYRAVSKKDIELLLRVDDIDSDHDVFSTC
jgi:CRISPR system Cascade subunit CasD